MTLLSLLAGRTVTVCLNLNLAYWVFFFFFFLLLCLLLNSFKTNFIDFFFKKTIRISKVWVQIKLDVWLGLIWDQIDCKGYQQASLVGKGLNSMCIVVCFV